MFVHRYSGQCKLKDNTLISMSYFIFALLVYKLASNVTDPSSRITLLGITMFLMGEYTNFYHHLILRNLRKDGSKEYKVCIIDVICHETPSLSLYFYVGTFWSIV